MLVGNSACAFTPMRLKKSTYEHIQRISTIRRNQSDNHGEEPLFYDDFDMGNSQSDNLYNPQGSLDANENIDYTSIFQKSVEEDEVRQDRITKNWESGNWKCRGFSLDKYSTEVTGNMSQDSDKNIKENTVKISKLAFDETASGPGFGQAAEQIAVGRTDGSVYLINLSHEYLTKFQAVPKLDNENDRDDSLSARLEMEMVNEDDINPSTDYDLGSINRQTDTRNPFEIECQFQAHGEGESITAMLFHDDRLYTSGGANGQIKAWKFGAVDGRTQIIPLFNLDTAHTGEVVCLKSLSISECDDITDHNLLLSASRDGSFGLWDMNGDMVFTCTLQGENGQPVTINCADVDISGDDHIIYLGLSDGHVVAYVASELVGSASDGGICPLPKCRFMSHDPTTSRTNDSAPGVTALVCAGEGTSRASASSSYIVTGGFDGTIKQWEMIKQKRENENQVEFQLMHWPRLGTQRLSQRAHILKAHHEGPVAALASSKGPVTRILSSGADGSIRVHDPSEEEDLYAMYGFEEDVTSICLDGEILVTNGMSGFVCIHDFDAEEDIDDAIQLDW